MTTDYVKDNLINNYNVGSYGIGNKTNIGYSTKTGWYIFAMTKSNSVNISEQEANLFIEQSLID